MSMLKLSACQIFTDRVPGCEHSSTIIFTIQSNSTGNVNGQQWNEKGGEKEDFAYIKHGITCPSVFPHPDGDNHKVLLLPLQLHLPAALLQAYHGCPDLVKLHKVFAPSLFLESLHHKAILIASLEGYKPTHPQKGNKKRDALMDTLIPLF
jgi:hypothetical protein